MMGIIVDGEGDFASLRTRFNRGFRILKTDGPRGHTPRPAEIAGRSRKQIAILKAYKCNQVVVVIDFEERNEPYERFVDELTKAFGLLEFGVTVSVAVPNRMIENWYLADIEYLSVNKAFLRKNLRQKQYEGTHGKAELKKCIEHGYSYRETKHGPQMFAILRFEVARDNSASLRHFLAVMGS